MRIYCVISLPFNYDNIVINDAFSLVHFTATAGLSLLAALTNSMNSFL